jgi:hypothetical protein
MTIHDTYKIVKKNQTFLETLKFHKDQTCKSQQLHVNNSMKNYKSSNLTLTIHM